MVEDPEPAIWALTQDYTAPDGSAHTRHGILVRVRVEDYGAGTVRPHERTLPGPQAGPARTDPRHRSQPLAHLLAQHRGRLAAGRARDPGRALGRGHRRQRHRQPCLADRRPGDPRGGERSGLAGAELLIADGHHRYETARAYRDEIGGEGPHSYTLMALTGLDDPGLTVYPTHRLLSGFADDAERQQRLGNGLRELFDVDRGRRRRTRPRRRGRASASSASTTPSTSVASGCG